MARSRIISHSSRFGTRRKTTWTQGPPFMTSSTAASASSAIILGLGLQSVLPGNTLVRTRGEFTAWLLSASAAGDGFVCAVGIGIVQEAAFSAGAASVPMPIDEADAEIWLWHRFFNVFSTAAGFESLPEAVRIEIDAKAMRKMDVTDRLYMAVQVIETGTAVIEMVANTRVLFKLP